MKQSYVTQHRIRNSEPWKSVATAKSLLQCLQNGEFLARVNPDLLSLSVRNALHGHLEVGLMVGLLDIPVGKRVLQVGCGSGIALPHLDRLCRPCALTAIDIDQRVLEESRQRLKDEQVSVQLFEADVRKMPFPDNSFDVVIDFGLCYYIEEPEAALFEISRVLDYSGSLVYETPLAQLLAHPRSNIKRLPWDEFPGMNLQRSKLLWETREKSMLSAI